jgi:hypothetical protein
VQSAVKVGRMKAAITSTGLFYRYEDAIESGIPYAAERVILAHARERWGVGASEREALRNYRLAGGTAGEVSIVDAPRYFTISPDHQQVLGSPKSPPARLLRKVIVS